MFIDLYFYFGILINIQLKIILRNLLITNNDSPAFINEIYPICTYNKTEKMYPHYSAN